MVVLRLARMGAKKVPFYRLVAADSRAPRGGRFIEQLGIYDPTRTPVEFKMNADRVQYWLSVGAQPSETVGQILKRHKKSAA